MDSFTLSRNWFNFSFENPDLISPVHSAILFFAIEHCNRLGGKEKFGFPTQMTMEALGIKKHQTYIKYLNDLVEWGFIKMIQKSTNQYSANIISLIYAMPKKGKALDKAFIKHAAKQTESIGQSKDSIDKQINNETNKQENNIEPVFNNESEIFDSFRKSYPGTKRGNKTEFDNFKKHKDWKEVLPTLENILINQKTNRVQLESLKQFVPEWKHLKTWINQRCWEEEIKIIEPVKNQENKLVYTPPKIEKPWLKETKI